MTDGILEEKWPKLQPSGSIQYTLVYNFYHNHRVPSTLFERVCVRIHKHLVPRGHLRCDWRNEVYIEQDKVQVVLQRRPSQSEPCMQIHLRSPISHLLKLKDLLLALYHDMENLCSELPGLVVDAYFLCPHCLMSRKEKPTRKSMKLLAEACSVKLDSVPCNPADIESEKIPTAMIFLTVLSNFHIFIYKTGILCSPCRKFLNAHCIFSLEFWKLFWLL